MMETRPHLLLRLSMKDRMSIFEFRKSEGNCGLGVWRCTLEILSASPRKNASESGALLRAVVRRALACALFSCDAISPTLGATSLMPSRMGGFDWSLRCHARGGSSCGPLEAPYAR